MLAILISIPIVWVVGLAFGYSLHKFLHSSKSGKLGRQHSAHHRLYTINDFTSHQYRDAGKDNSTIIFFIAALPLAAIPIIFSFAGVFPIYLTISIILEMSLIGYLNVYIHDTFHIRNHWLNRAPIINRFYKRLIKDHFIHHKFVKTNFGIFSFEFDKLFGTYRKSMKNNA